MTIWRFPFEIDDSVLIEMPEGATVLKVECQNGVPCIWALVKPDAPKQQRLFLVYGTGHHVDGVGAQHHVATFQQGPFVWHMFEQKGLT